MMDSLEQLDRRERLEVKGTRVRRVRGDRMETVDWPVLLVSEEHKGHLELMVLLELLGLQEPKDYQVLGDS